jgi:hypothetical protein
MPPQKISTSGESTRVEADPLEHQPASYWRFTSLTSGTTSTCDVLTNRCHDVGVGRLIVLETSI